VGIVENRADQFGVDYNAHVVEGLRIPTKSAVDTDRGRLYRLKPTKDSDDPGCLPRRAQVLSPCSSAIKIMAKGHAWPE
jgi:hypothetical protein